MSNIDKRDVRLDMMRSIAIICIIIAHSSPGGIIFQLRNFDVICMVTLIGASAYLSNKNKKIIYTKYIYKRIKRLVFPTIKFLTVFFILFYLISLFQGKTYYFNLNTIISSYTLIDGIGYVWIIRVFVLISITMPFILKLNNLINKNLIYGLVLCIVYFIYAILIHINLSLDGVDRFIYENFIIYGISYSIIAAVGVRLIKLNKKELNLVTLTFFMIFIFMMIKNNFTPTQQFKYPPSMYYISYGMFVTMFLYRLTSLEAIKNLCDNKIVEFISCESMNIYMNHIIGIYLLKLIPFLDEFFGMNFITRFAFMFGIAISITVIKNRLNNKYEFKADKLLNKFYSYNK